MPMYNLIDYSHNYSEKSRSLSQYCRKESDNNITDSQSLKSKLIFLDNTDNDGIVDVETVALLKYLCGF